MSPLQQPGQGLGRRVEGGAPAAGDQQHGDARLHHSLDRLPERLGRGHAALQQGASHAAREFRIGLKRRHGPVRGSVRAVRGHVAGEGQAVVGRRARAEQHSRALDVSSLDRGMGLKAGIDRDHRRQGRFDQDQRADGLRAAPGGQQRFGPAPGVAHQVGALAEPVGDPHRVALHVVDAAGRAPAEARTVDHLDPPALRTQRLLPREGGRAAAQAALHAPVDDQHPRARLAPTGHVDREMRRLRLSHVGDHRTLGDQRVTVSGQRRRRDRAGRGWSAHPRARLRRAPAAGPAKEEGPVTPACRCPGSARARTRRRASGAAARRRRSRPGAPRRPGWVRRRSRSGWRRSRRRCA